MRTRLVLTAWVCLAGLLFGGSPAVGFLIDDFSVDSSSRYVEYAATVIPGNTGIYTRNTVDGTFQPTATSASNADHSSTTYFLRNDGYLLGAGGGDRASVDIDRIAPNSSAAGGLGFATDQTGHSSGPFTDFEVAVQAKPAGGYQLAGLPFDAMVPPLPADLAFSQSQPLNLSVFREFPFPFDFDDYTYDYVLSGGNLTTNVTGTFNQTGTIETPMFVGLIYSTGPGVTISGNAELDNLTFTPVPEPTCLAPLSIGQLALRRRRCRAAAPALSS